MATITTVDRLEGLPEDVPDVDIVVVDVLLASTAIVRLLDAGVEYVKPFADINEARAFGATVEDAVLVGEDGGAPIDGFDFVPLPETFRTDELAGRPVAMRSSNGTRAIESLDRDEEVFVGTTTNAAAVANVLCGRGRDVWLVAAGRHGEVAPEDSAGVELIEKQYHGTLTKADTERFSANIRTAGTADWLRSIGMEDELESVLSFNSTDTVPVLRDGVFVDAVETP